MMMKDDGGENHNDNANHLIVDGKSWCAGAMVRTRGVDAQVRTAAVVFPRLSGLFGLLGIAGL